MPGKLSALVPYGFDGQRPQMTPIETTSEARTGKDFVGRNCDFERKDLRKFDEIVS